MSTFFFRLQFFLELANQSLNQDFGSREQLYWRSAKEFRASRASSESSGLPSTRLDRSIPPPILGNHWENGRLICVSLVLICVCLRVYCVMGELRRGQSYFVSEGGGG